MLIKVAPNKVVNLKNADSIDLLDYCDPDEDEPIYGIFALFGEKQYTIFGPHSLEVAAMVFERLVTVMGGATEIVENDEVAVLTKARNLHREVVQAYCPKRPNSD